MIDVPTLTSATAANYAVMNPVFKSNSQPTFSNANLSVSPNTGTYQNTFATIAVTSGKWYAEILVTGAPNSANFVGVSSLSEMNVLVTTSSVVGVTSTGYSLQIVNGDKYTNGSGSAYGSPYSSGDILQIALDLDNGKLWFGKNGTWQVSGDPSAGTNPTFSGITGSNGFALGCTLYSAGVTSFSVNFGQQPWSYTPPTGFVALNTYNLPASSIPNGAAYMAATLYTGTGSAQSISNAVGSASFQPDFVWQKARAEVAGHRLVDSVRGATKVLYSNSTSAEATTSGVVDAFNSGGFTGGGSDVVTSGLAAVAWQWKAGGTAVSNTSGSITSSVSANTTSGFSVVTWTSPASGVPTIGHGLGVAPTFIIVKDRTTAYNWDVGCDSIGWANRLNLNTTNVAYAGYWNSTAPTSSVFTYTAAGANSGDLMVAYCFTPIKGFSAFGSYTGNGSTDGPFVYLGFRPRYVMLKVSSTAGYDWLVYDSSRDTYNVTQNNLRANTNDAESTQTANYLDFLSNGFKIRGSSAGSINPSQTVIYAAFAENPFQNSLAR
jgi:hypothetical protein